MPKWNWDTDQNKKGREWWDKNIAWDVPRVSSQRLLFAQISFEFFSAIFIALIFYTVQVVSVNHDFIPLLAILMGIAFFLSIHFAAIWFRHINKTEIDDKFDKLIKNSEITNAYLKVIAQKQHINTDVIDNKFKELKNGESKPDNKPDNDFE